MLYIKVHDVGDGLFLDCCFGGSRLVTDFGSRQKIDLSLINKFAYPFCWQFDFALSHFHLDHYSGLFMLSDRSVAIDRVYYPRLPQNITAADRKKFLIAFAILNLYLLGDDSGSMEYDLISLIKRINKQKKFEAIPVSQGDTIDLGRKSFRVLWPPKDVKDDKDGIVESVKRVLIDFEKEIKDNKTLKQIYDKIKKKDIYYQDEKTEHESYDVESGKEYLPERRHLFDEYNQRMVNIKDLNDIGTKLIKHWQQQNKIIADANRLTYFNGTITANLGIATCSRWYDCWKRSIMNDL